MNKKILVLFVFCLVACAPRGENAFDGENSSGIIGGKKVSARSKIAKFIVAVVTQDERSQSLCTGVIISPSAILTAAHCAMGMKAGRIIFSSSLKTRSAETMRTVERVVVEPQYAAALAKLRGQTDPSAVKNWADLSIMKFSGGLPNGFEPVQWLEEPLRNGEKVALAGFGLTDGVKKTESKGLRAVKVAVHEAQYSRTEFTVAKGACHGDSGGPAFAIRNKEILLAGITSRGFDAACTLDSIYTRVSAFAAWIHSSM